MWGSFREDAGEAPALPGFQRNAGISGRGQVDACSGNAGAGPRESNGTEAARITAVRRL